MTAFGSVPRVQIRKDALEKIGNPVVLSFETFMVVVDECRSRDAEEKRKSAGFSEKNYDTLLGLFNNHLQTGKNVLEKGELLWLLMEIGIPVSTNEERDKIFSLLDEARESVIRAELSETDAGEMGTCSATFWTLLHLLKKIVRKDEAKAISQEEEAIEQANFSRTEINEFRDVFMDWVNRDKFLNTGSDKPGDWDIPKDNDPSPGRRASLPDIYGGFPSNDGTSSVPAGALRQRNRPNPLGAATQPLQTESAVQFKDLLGDDGHDARLSIDGMKMLLCSIGLLLDVRQSNTVVERARKISGRQDASMCFADFLLLMRWMLDTNFAEINFQSERFIERVKQASPQKKKVIEPLSPTPSIAQQ